MSIKVNVACPVCGKTLRYEHKEDEAWGSVSVRDFGIVEVTAHDRGLIREHVNTHTYDEVTEAQKRHGYHVRR